MTEQNKPKPRIKHPDRITLSPNLLAIIDQHIGQASKNGVSFSRKDYLFWRIKRLPEKLTLEEIKELTEMFFDEERLLRHTLKELQTARKEGRKLSAKDLLVEGLQNLASIQKP